MQPSISILIITYNRPEDTLALLENLERQVNLAKHAGEILLLNNASTVSYAGIEEFIRAHPALPIQYILHDKNAGVAGGRNFLIRKARYPSLLVLDDDILLPDAHAIEQIASLWKRPQFVRENTAVITLNIFYYDTQERQKSALPHKKYTRHKDKSWFLTYYFTGAAHVMRKELFEHTGLYPEDFFYGMEEYDLSYRIIEAGYTLAYDSTVTVLHKESPTGRVTNKQKLGMMWRNKSKVAWRYLPRKYFYTTMIMWSLQYLKETGLDIRGFMQAWQQLLQIPATERRTPVSRRSLDYLKKVHARLWY